MYACAMNAIILKEFLCISFTIYFFWYAHIVVAYSDIGTEYWCYFPYFPLFAYDVMVYRFILVTEMHKTATQYDKR